MKMMTIEDMKELSKRLYVEALRYSTISQVYHDLMDACAVIDHYVKLVESKSLSEDDGEQLFSPELPTDQVLKIGRDFQNQDSWHGAHYDTARLLCDTIVRLSRKLKKEKENVSRQNSEHEEQGLEHATEVR